jgi:hypothetical protein
VRRARRAASPISAAGDKSSATVRAFPASPSTVESLNLKNLQLSSYVPANDNQWPVRSPGHIAPPPSVASPLKHSQSIPSRR